MAAANDADFLEFVVGVERSQSLQRYAHRWLTGLDPVHAADVAPDLAEVGRTYDRLMAFAATRDIAVHLTTGSMTVMYHALLSVIHDQAR